ncbi:unnamed protein product [Rhodiola kirilowii]
MDFITGLPRSNSKKVILVVVDRLSKYAHFSALEQHFTAESVAKCFIRDVCKLHGIPTNIVSDRDLIFMSSFWRELFRLQGTTLSHSTAYHPQSDGQTEVTNRTLEDYLRCYVNETQTDWAEYLPWAELHYNTAWHSGTQLTPYEAVYGRPPPAILDYEPHSSSIAAVDDLLRSRTEILQHLRTNLLRAQQRMTQQANLHRTDTEFAVHDWVLLRLQPYRQTSLRPRRSPKLAKRFYGPFQITARIGPVAYRLALPPAARIHDVFHVSLLKRCKGGPPFPHIEWPDSFSGSHLILTPERVLASRTIQRHGSLIPQVRILWKGQHIDNSTWEDITDLQSDYPEFNLEVEVSAEGGSNVTPKMAPTAKDDKYGRGKRAGISSKRYPRDEYVQ